MPVLVNSQVMHISLIGAAVLLPHTATNTLMSKILPKRCPRKNKRKSRKSHTVWWLKGHACFCCLQKTRAYHRLQDDVPADVKQRRLEELITVFREEAARANEAMVGQSQLVLVEGVSVLVRAAFLPSHCPRGS